MEKRIIVYIGLGSNLGDGLKTLQNAWGEIGETEQITLMDLSHPYLSAPVDMESSNWFTNGVGQVETSLDPAFLLDKLMGIESRFGRRRNKDVAGYQDRSLDLDIIYCGEMVIQSRKLMVPHPYLAQRLFVLEPLAEIAPLFRDPIDGQTMLEKRETLQRQMAGGDLPLQEISRTQWS